MQNADEEKRADEKRKRNEAYWSDHEEERKKMESERDALQEDVDRLQEQIDPYKAEISEKKKPLGSSEGLSDIHIQSAQISNCNVMGCSASILNS